MLIWIWMVLPSRGVRQAAIGTAKVFDRPYTIFHRQVIRRSEHPGPAQQFGTFNELLL